MLDFDDTDIEFMSSNSLIEEVRSMNDDIQKKRTTRILNRDHLTNLSKMKKYWILNR